jgi:hypothetical protein
LRLPCWHSMPLRFDSFGSARCQLSCARPWSPIWWQLPFFARTSYAVSATQSCREVFGHAGADITFVVQTCGEAVVQEPILQACELASPEDDPRPEGPFDDAWNVLRHGHQVEAILIDSVRLGLLQRPSLDRSSRCTDCPVSFRSLAADELQRVRHLASAGGQFAVFFAVEASVVGLLETAFGGSFLPAPLPPIRASGARCVERLLAAYPASLVLSFAHDGDPVYLFTRSPDSLPPRR